MPRPRPRPRPPPAQAEGARIRHPTSPRPPPPPGYAGTREHHARKFTPKNTGALRAPTSKDGRPSPHHPRAAARVAAVPNPRAQRPLRHQPGKNHHHRPKQGSRPRPAPQRPRRVTPTTITALCAPHSARKPALSWGRVAASSPFQKVRPHPLRERGLTLLLYNPAATLLQKVKVKSKSKSKTRGETRNHPRPQKTRPRFQVSPRAPHPASTRKTRSKSKSKPGDGTGDGKMHGLNQAQATRLPKVNVRPAPGKTPSNCAGKNGGQARTHDEARPAGAG
jgi:hypothetical protein